MSQKILIGPGAGNRQAQARGVRLGRVAGVMVQLDWSLLIIFALITLALAGGPLPAWHPDWGRATVWLTAVTAAVLFLVSVLAHELAHAIVGRRLGIQVRQVTLFVFGGMAHMEDEPESWHAELAMAIAGPITSLVLGALCIYLSALMAGPIAVDPADPAAALAQLSPLATIFFWLGPINILLGVFNMVPGFPLDGARVLRALLWGLLGDLLRATRWAAAAGEGFAWLLIGSGIAMILGLSVPIFGSGPVAGLWLALIGWFLNHAALTGYQQAMGRQTLGDLPVTRVMHRDFIEVAPSSTVQDFIDAHLLESSQRVFPVVEGGQLLGLVGLADVRRLDRGRRVETQVAEIMTPTGRLHRLTPTDKAIDALKYLAEHRVNQIPVVTAEGGLLGSLPARIS